MSLAQGNNTPTRPRIEPGSPDPESDALTTRTVRPPQLAVCILLAQKRNRVDVIDSSRIKTMVSNECSQKSDIARLMVIGILKTYNYGFKCSLTFLHVYITHPVSKMVYNLLMILQKKMVTYIHMMNLRPHFMLI